MHTDMLKKCNTRNQIRKPYIGNYSTNKNDIFFKKVSIQQIFTTIHNVIRFDK